MEIIDPLRIVTPQSYPTPLKGNDILLKEGMMADTCNFQPAIQKRSAMIRLYTVFRLNERCFIIIPSILLIDDDEVDTEAFNRAFRLHQLPNKIICALDGLEALEILCGKMAIPPLPKPYIIFLDINMPRMNGLEFLHQLRQDPNLKGSVVFVLTTSNRPEDKLAAYQKQIAGYILKENVGKNFTDTIRLLEDYQAMVILPN